MMTLLFAVAPITAALSINPHLAQASAAVLGRSRSSQPSIRPIDHHVATFAPLGQEATKAALDTWSSLRRQAATTLGGFSSPSAGMRSITHTNDATLDHPAIPVLSVVASDGTTIASFGYRTPSAVPATP